MANIGRFFCVALPFILTLCSLVTLLVACLGGITDKGLYMFRVNTTNLEINPDSIKSLIQRDLIDDAKDLLGIDSDSESSNITAPDLGLADVYEISLWGYCMTDLSRDKKECTKPKFDWASSTLNTDFIERLSSISGTEIDIPDEVESGLKLFNKVTKWTEVAYIVALVTLGVQLVFGVFAQCSRALSCIVWIIAGFAATFVCVAASLSTAMSVVVVGTVKSTARLYGVTAGFQVAFLALIWVSAAFAIGAAFFWLFTICCCAPDHSRRKSKRGSASFDNEKLLPTDAYQPLHEPNMHGGNNPDYSTSYGAPRYPSGAPRSDLAYEPYSHR